MAAEEDPKKVRARLEAEVALWKKEQEELASKPDFSKFGSIGNRTLFELDQILDSPEHPDFEDARDFNRKAVSLVQQSVIDMEKRLASLTSDPLRQATDKLQKQALQARQASDRLLEATRSQVPDISISTLVSNDIRDQFRERQKTREKPRPAENDPSSRTENPDSGLPAIAEVQELIEGINSLGQTSKDHLAIAKKSGQFWVLSVLGGLTLLATIIMPFIRP